MTHRLTGPCVIAVAAALITAATACTGIGNDYTGYTDLPADGWLYGDTLTFVPQHSDSIATADIILSLRHAPDYPYSNVWLEVTTAQPPRRDTVNIALCDKYGRWYGNGIGVSYQVSDTVARHITHVTGTPVYVRHIMRADTLAGISQLGIELTN